MNKLLRRACAAMTTLIVVPLSYASGQTMSNDAPCGVGSAASFTGTKSDSARTGSASARSDTNKTAAVVLYAAANVGEITFARQPEIRVRLCGGLDSIHVVDRRNLPNPVVVGHTYRDVYVAVEIFGRVNADCIVAAITSAPCDSTGQRNACASVEVSGTRSRPPND